MHREHQDRTPARPQRARVRAVMFAWHRDTPFTDADVADLRAQLNVLPGVEWAFALHDKDAGRDHLQGCARFKHPRDIAIVEALLPEFVVAPLKGRLAFQKMVRYLGHCGVYPVISNVDRDKLIAGLPDTKPTIEELEADVFWGRRTVISVGDAFPSMVARHLDRLERAALNGERHRNAARYARNSARAKAQAGASRPRAATTVPVADSAAITTEKTYSWLLAEQRYHAEAAADLRDSGEDDQFWLVATIADLEQLPGDAADRRHGVEQLVGGEASVTRLLAWFESEYGDDAEQARDGASDYEEHVAEQASVCGWHEADAAGGDETAFRRALDIRRKAARYPDLYPLEMPHARLAQTKRAALLAAHFNNHG
ncbi:hypothetical protein [Gordonia sp. SND2]|uniref:hypothetical protein n=1 Tax=Gordonia sp. SND2 TaxID=3388659 RepID=UPI00398B95B3